MIERVVSGSAQLCCEVAGRGDPLVLLHAGVADRRSFAAVLPMLAAVGRVIAYDRRGFGDTIYTPQPFCHLADLLAVVDGTCRGRVTLVGNSQGARIAIDFALAHPERVDALVLVAPAISGAPPPSRTAAEASLHEAIEAAEQHGDLDLVNRLEARLWLDGPEVPEGRVRGDVRRLFLDMNGRALSAEPPGPARDTPNAFDRLQAIRVPVHVVLGELDQTAIHARGRALVERIPHCTLSTIAGVAHLPMLERPDAFAREVLNHRG